MENDFFQNPPPIREINSICNHFKGNFSAWETKLNTKSPPPGGNHIFMDMHVEGCFLKADVEIRASYFPQNIVKFW